jgi:predicted HD superfamily hydrolase involved in NAD metabolism
VADLAAQLAVVQAEMASRPASLLEHVQRVAREAIELGEYWDVDPARLELAAWGHDLFRHEPEARQLELAAEAGLKVSKHDRASPMVLHGPVASAVLRERFGVADAEVLAAIRDHTLGLAEMSMIAKCILLADKVEAKKRRRDPEMVNIRKVARRDLDLALLCWADWKWVEERANGWHSHPQHWKARAAWIREHHFDADPTDDRPTCAAS